MPDMRYSDLALGDMVYEIEPWCGMVHARIINTMVETAVLRLGTFERTVERAVAFRINGPLTHDNSLKERDWGVRFFGDREQARRALAEQTLKLKAERRANMEKELAELQRQLEEGDG